MIIAGEASGDLHGAKLVEAMLARDPSLFICGVGGRALRKAGVRILVEASELSVVGITEVFSKIRSLWKGASRVKKLLKGLKPDLLIIIDFPDFNLHAAAIAKRQGIPVFYYISPQIWAWRKGRVKKIKRLVDHVGVILPFEEEFYHQYDVPVTFVGHPLLDQDAYVHKEHNIQEDDADTIIGLLPGSRDKEVFRNLPVMLTAAAHIQKRYPEMRFEVSHAPSVSAEIMDRILDSSESQINVHKTTDPVSSVFNRCCLVIAVSGTVTLEAALSATPTVIIYSVSALSYWIGRALIHVDHIGLINLIAGKEIVPELIQKDAAPKPIADCVLSFLDNPDRLKGMHSELIAARDRLGGPGASKRAADLALNILERKNA
jgi:lipid-A-disaccharide synthase